jgi:hypothetical protein
MRAGAWLAAVLLAWPGAEGARAATPHAGAQYRYWAFSNGNDLRDVLAYWVPGPFHVQLEYWDFVHHDAADQFRPEVGVHLRDARRSVYTLQWRHEHRQERYWAGTEQVLSDRVVGRLEVSPIVPHDATVFLPESPPPPRSTQWVLAAGADAYWGGWSFLSVTLIRDPRGSGLWVAPARLRLATERNDWLQATVAPASSRTLGWALDGSWRGMRLGVERNSRYDFTDLDNTIVTVGYEIRWQRPE